MKILVAQRLATAIACLGMIVPPSAFAGNPFAGNSTLASPVADVALGAGGQFTGKVVNAQGAPVSATTVSLRQEGQEVANTTTDEQGRFGVQGLRGGQYQVVTENGSVVYRLWAPQTAPPAANSSALIVTGTEIMNGQYCDGGCGGTCGQCRGGNGGGGVLGWMKQHPILVAAGIATAIAVPLALADDDDPASP